LLSRGPLQEDLENGEDVATCPSCSLILRVVYDQVGAGRGLPGAAAASFPGRRVGRAAVRFAVPAFEGPW